jgi:hypothetical protein
MRKSGAQRRRAQRLRLFDRGAEAAARVIAELHGSDNYVCPICGNAFGRDAIDDATLPLQQKLTLEHVPPRTFVNAPFRAVMLTCGRCNSEAGRKVDSSARVLQDVREFSQGGTSRMVKIRLRLPESPMSIPAEVEGANISAILERGGPQTQAEWENALRVDVHGREFKFSGIFMVNLRLARLGHLRSAYLTAFTALGYTYALSEILWSVRRQLCDFDKPIVSRYHYTMRRGDEWHVILLEGALPAIYVQMDQDVVLLPANEKFAYEDLPEQLGTDVLVGRELPWPTEPTYQLDRKRVDDYTSQD